jgi:hypothetical protein
LIALSFNVFEDPLWAARFASIIEGFFSLFEIYFIEERLLFAWVDCFATLFYKIYPYYSKKTLALQ